MQLPNVRLEIPTKNATLTRFVPEFIVPLYKAAWKGFIEDEHGNPIVVKRISKHPRYDYCRYTYVDSLGEYENRLFSQWSGSVRVDQRAIWESVFGDDGSFQKSAQAWAKKNDVSLDGDADTDEEADLESPRYADQDVRAVNGIGNARAEDLSQLLDIKTVGHLAGADAEAVSKACTIPVEKAQEYIDKAQLMIDEE